MGLEFPATLSAVRAKGKGVALARAYGLTCFTGTATAVSTGLGTRLLA